MGSAIPALFSVVVVKPNLPANRLERRGAPKVGGLDIVVRVGVEAFIRILKFIELVQDEKNGIEAAAVFHKTAEGFIAAVRIPAKRIVGTIRFGVGIGTSPAGFLACRSDGCREILHAVSAANVARIVRA